MVSSLICTILVFAAVAIVGNAFVVGFFLWYYTLKAISTRLIFFIHATAVLQMVTSMPYIYTGSTAMCKLTAFLHYYFGLANMIIIVLLTLLYNNILQKNNDKLEYFIKQYGLKFSFIFSLITVLPFSTDAYGQVNDWCTITLAYSAVTWSFVVFYFWIYICMGICIYLFARIMYQTSKFDVSIQRRLFWSLGIYILVTLISLLFRAVPRVVLLFNVNRDEGDDDSDSGPTAVYEFIVEFPLYLVGIAYFFCFYFNQKEIDDYLENDSRRISTFQVTLEDFDQVIGSAIHASVDRRDSEQAQGAVRWKP